MGGKYGYGGAHTGVAAGPRVDVSESYVVNRSSFVSLRPLSVSPRGPGRGDAIIVFPPSGGNTGKGHGNGLNALADVTNLTFYKPPFSAYH